MLAENGFHAYFNSLRNHPLIKNMALKRVDDIEWVEKSIGSITQTRAESMHGIGVHIAVIQEKAILLIQREDFEVWGLPSGEIEPGETPAEAAVRETYEETGLTVRLTRLVGLYTIPQMPTGNKTNAVFAAEVISGSLKSITNETLNAAFFTLETLPEDLIWWSRQRILDALVGIGGSAVWTQNVPMLTGNSSRQDLYRRRDESGLPPAEFFQNNFPKGSETNDIVGSDDTSF